MTSEGVEVQDNARESAMAALLGLTTTGKRNGFDATDAAGNPYELKTTSVTDVGTGRDVGRIFIAKLRAGYFVAAKTAAGGGDWRPAQIIFCHPKDLEEWIKDKLENRIAADESLRDRVATGMRGSLAEQEIARVAYLMDRGMTYNNPKISWAYLEAHGVKLDLTRPAAHLATLVKARPL